MPSVYLMPLEAATGLVPHTVTLSNVGDFPKLPCAPDDAVDSR